MIRILPAGVMVAVLILLAAPASLAQRKVIGGSAPEDAEPEEKEAKPVSPEERAAAQAAKKAAAEKADAAKAKALEDKLKAEEAKREAARQAREAEAQKKREAEEAAKAAADAAVQKRLDENRTARLSAAERRRRFVRDAGTWRFAIAAVPGAPRKNRVQELNIDVQKRSNDPGASFTGGAPVTGADLIASIVGPDGAQQRFRVHALDAPGTYGFHFTPIVDGTHEVRIAGTAGDGALATSLVLHVDAWPPPDFDDEEKALAGATESRRRPLSTEEEVD